MTILLLGADGQVGFELQRALGAFVRVRAATRRGVLPSGSACLGLDLADPVALRAAIRALHPRMIVNAAAYTAVDKAENAYDAAFAANGTALGVLGDEAKALGAHVIHYSTDYVFAGDGRRPYRPDDPVAPLNAYGRSKLAGEELLRASGAEHTILRTAWVYAARGRNFLRTMLRLGAERERLTVVADQRGTPTSARSIAEVTAVLVRAVLAGNERAHGTHHLTCAGETTWHDFADAIMDCALRAGLLAHRPTVAPIATSDYPTPARRPSYSVLDTSSLESALAITLPDWRSALDDVIGELAAGSVALPGRTG
jgi:dTDP-4-dehydrorhamnose reductase